MPYYHALKASRSPPHICTCVHAWLWQKISLEAASEEARQQATLCFLQRPKIDEIASEKWMMLSLCSYYFGGGGAFFFLLLLLPYPFFGGNSSGKSW